MNTPNFFKRKRAALVGGRGGKRIRNERTTYYPYDVEEYLQTNPNNLDAESFRHCRTGVYPGILMVEIKEGVTIDSRLAAWNCRWRHLSNKVLCWPAPNDSDSSWFQTEVERAN